MVDLFSQGVRAYDLGNWDTAAAHMQTLIETKSAAAPPKEVRMSGTRFVPYAPHWYQAMAWFQDKSPCALVQAGLLLADAAAEPVPTELQSTLQAARKQCGAQQ
jgi:hypothetical protein